MGIRNEGHTRVIPVKRYAKLAEAREELGFDIALEDVVHALVHGRLNVPIRLADADNLGDLPPCIRRGASVLCGITDDGER